MNHASGRKSDDNGYVMGAGGARGHCWGKMEVERDLLYWVGCLCLGARISVGCVVAATWQYCMLQAPVQCLRCGARVSSDSRDHVLVSLDACCDGSTCTKLIALNLVRYELLAPGSL